jgi:hypothetical protein
MSIARDCDPSNFLGLLSRRYPDPYQQQQVANSLLSSVAALAVSKDPSWVSGFADFLGEAVQKLPPGPCNDSAWQLLGMIAIIPDPLTSPSTSVSGATVSVFDSW